MVRACNWRTPAGTTPLDVAKSVSPRLADSAIVAKVNGELYDLTRPIEADATVQILTPKDSQFSLDDQIRRFDDAVVELQKLQEALQKRMVRARQVLELHSYSFGQTRLTWGN